MDVQLLQHHFFLKGYPSSIKLLFLDSLFCAYPSTNTMLPQYTVATVGFNNTVYQLLTGINNSTDFILFQDHFNYSKTYAFWY